VHGRPDRSKLFTASLFTLSKEKASEGSKMHAGLGGMWGTQSSLSFCAGVQFSHESLRAFNDRIKIEKIEGCE